MSKFIDSMMAFLEPYLDWLSSFYEELKQHVHELGNLQDMSTEVLASLLLFSLELVIGLIAVIVMMTLASGRRHRKDVSLAKDIKNRIQAYLPKRKENLRAMITELVPHDEEWAAKTAQEAVDYEKGVYSRILKIIMRQELDVAQNITTDIERLGESYKRILANLGDGAVGSGGGDENEKISELKSIVAKLRKEKQKLQDELEESVKSVDGIVKEYSRMYSDAPHKEGVEHLEREVAQLRDKVGVHLERDLPEKPDKIEEGPGEIIDLQADVPEVDVPEVEIPDSIEDSQEGAGEEKEEHPEVDPSPALKKLKDKIGFGKDKK